MADLSDVQNTLVGIVAGALYPNGTGQSSAPAGSPPCRVYAGWPNAVALDADLRAGKINVSIFGGGPEKNTTRYPRDWQLLSITPPTLTLVAAGQTVTVGGTAGAGQNAALIVNRRGYVYATQQSDTLASIATALAALVAVDVPGTTSVGPVITIPSGAVLAARVGTSGVSIREVRRQQKVLQITVWAPTPGLRDAVVKPIDLALADLDFITLPDSSLGRLIYERTAQDDTPQKALLYRRDLFYAVEYPTTEIRTDATLTITDVTFHVQIGGQDVAVTTDAS